MNDNLNITYDTDTYKVFDEEGHMLFWLSGQLELVPKDCTATSLETGSGRHSWFYIERYTH